MLDEERVEEDDESIVALIDEEELDDEDEDLDFEESEVADLTDDVEQIATDDIDDPVIDFDDNKDSVGTDSDVGPGDSVDDNTGNRKSDDELLAEVFGTDQASKFFDESSGEVETIIMEGEIVRSAIEKERLEADRKSQANIAEASRLADTYATSREKLRGGRRFYDPPSHVVTIGIVLLSILMIAQIVHARRDSLATSELFSSTVAPIYRLLGQPITPEWDVKGWQFEATNGSTNEDESVLTVVSRIGNQAELALPYPLVHVSLTDRWEEIIGSRILEPNEYLAGDLDPSTPVNPGDTFTAVISIENPSPDATGFRLDVCYRVETGRVRCAIKDFK